MKNIKLILSILWIWIAILWEVIKFIGYKIRDFWYIKILKYYKYKK